MTRVIAVEQDYAGLSRVRMGSTKGDGSVVIMHDGVSHTLVTCSTQYLDGHEYTTEVAGSFRSEEELPYDVIPARSKDVTDFGRLTAAARSLAVSMSAFGPGIEPSPEQLVIFAQGVANLQAWRTKARDAMAQAEGQIEAAETMLAQML